MLEQGIENDYQQFHKVYARIPEHLFKDIKKYGLIRDIDCIVESALKQAVDVRKQED